MFRKGLFIFCVSVPILFAVAVGAEEKTPNRVVISTLVDKVKYSHWIKNSFTMSQDGKHIAYVAEDGDKMTVIVDGRKGNRYDSVLPGTLLFSPNSQSLAYAANEENRWFVVSDGSEGKRYEGILDNSVTFSKDNLHLAYGVKSGGTTFVVLDGKEGIQYGGNSFIEADSIVIDSSTCLHYLVVDGCCVYSVKETIE